MYFFLHQDYFAIIWQKFFGVPDGYLLDTRNFDFDYLLILFIDFVEYWIAPKYF